MLVDCTLLIADDDAAFRETVAEMLEPHFQTITVESGEVAVQVAQTVSFDLALLDMHMHVLSGLETLQALHRIRSGLPCILMSSEMTPALEDAALELQAFSVIRKPPRRQQLIDTIHCALRL